MRPMSIAELYDFSRTCSAQGELDVDHHLDRYRLAQAHARFEAPQLHGIDRFLIEARRRVERVLDGDVGADAVWLDDAPYARDPLQLRFHRFCRVFRLWHGDGNR